MEVCIETVQDSLHTASSLFHAPRYEFGRDFTGASRARRSWNTTNRNYRPDVHITGEIKTIREFNRPDMWILPF